MRSAGSRSGVNCRRWNDRWQAWDSVLTISVLARPGRPSSSTWPPASSATRRRCTSCCWPTTCRPIWADSAWAQGIGAAARSRPGPASLRTVMGLLAPGGVRRSHTRTVRSAPAETRRLPPGAKASAVTPPPWPSSRASSRAVMTSMTRIDVASPATARVRPSSARAKCVALRMVRKATPVSGSQSITARAGDVPVVPALSALVTSRRPARAKATLRTVVPGPCATNDRSFSPFAFHSVRVPSLPPVRHGLRVRRERQRRGAVGRVDADQPPAFVQPPDREALAAAVGGHLLGQRQGGVVRDGAEEEPDVAGELGPLGAAGEVPDAQGIVLGAGRRDRGGAVWRERDGDDVALVAVSGEPRDGLSAADVPDADGAVAVAAAREGARAVAGNREADRGRGVAGERPQQPRAAGRAGRRRRGRLGRDAPPGMAWATGPKGERPNQSSHPPTPPASTATARAAAIARRRVIRRR